MTCHVIRGPTSPAVPIPEPVALFVMWNSIVPTGPRIALDKDRGNPYLGMPYDIRHLKHGCPDPLRQETAELILPPARHGESDHIAAAAHRSRSRPPVRTDSGSLQGRRN